MGERSLKDREFLGPRLLEEERRPFTAHLEELRTRFLRSLLWVIAGAGISFFFSGRILSLFLRPVGKVVFLNPAEPFLVHLKVAFLAGTLLALPLLAWEAWGFFGPALFPRERRAILLLVPASCGLFFLGVWTSWKFLLPVGLNFLLSFASPELFPMITLESYVRFAGWLLVGCGLFFQMPIVILVLSRAGMVSPHFLLCQWRVALLAILLLAAFLTPTPDVMTQLLLAVPMTLLYLLSVGLAFLAMPRGQPLR